MGSSLGTLPEGFTFADEEDESQDAEGLPEGFTFAEEKKPKEDFTDIRSRFKEAQGFGGFFEATERAEKMRDIGKEAEQIARQNLGYSDKSLEPKEREELNAEVDRILDRETFAGGGIAPITAQEKADLSQRETFEATGKGLLSGSTLGLSENLIDKEVPERFKRYYEGGKAIGEFAPVTGLMKIFKLPKHAAQGASYAKKALTSLGNILKAGGVGGSKKALEDVFQGKVPDYSDVIEHGASWAALDAILQTGGAGWNAIKGALERNIKSGANGYEVLNKMSKELQENGVNLEKIDEFAEEAFQFLDREANAAEQRAANPDVRGRDLRDRKVEKKYWEEIEEKIPQEFEAPEIEIDPSELPRDPVAEESLDTLAERPQDSTELGEGVQKDVDRRVVAARNEYKPRYDLAAEDATGVHPNTNKVARNAWEKFEEIRGDFSTRPEDYDKTLGILESLMKDLGAQFERNEAGEITGLLFSNEIPMDKLMELGRRSGRMANYGNINPKIRDAVKTVNQDIKQLIRDNLKKERPEAYEMWKEAEKIYTKKAKIFDNPTVMKIRNEEFKAEDISKMIKKPSDLGKIKEAVSPEEFKKIQRELLGEMNEMSYDKAQKFYRELKRHMDGDARKLADEILLSKKPITKMSNADKNRELERWVTNKVNQPVPSAALNKLWDSKLGQQRIRNALKDNPNKDSIIEFLQNQKIQNSSKKWIKESGEFNYGEMKNWLSKKQNREAVRDVAGQDGVKFLDEVANFANKAKQREKIYETLAKKPLSQFKPPKRGDEIIEQFKQKIKKADSPLVTKVEDLWNSIPKEDKDILTLFGMFKFGVYKALFLKKIIPHILNAAKHPRLRNSIRSAMETKSTNPWVLYSTWKGLGNELEENEG